MSAEDRPPIGSAVSDAGVTWAVGGDGIAEIRFDTPGGKVNLINPPTLAALDEALAFLARRDDVVGLVLASAKPGAFIAGADVKIIASVGSEKEAREKAMGGQMVFSMLASLPFPTVAAIAGACLGGGCELALACSLRVAADADEVQIGLPEVRLGIVPGWGGTQRLPRLIGLPAALDMILTGRTLTAREALRAGLVDALAVPERLLAEARRLLLRRSTAVAARTSGSGGPAARGADGPAPGARGASVPPRRMPLLQRILLAQPARGFILARAAAAARKAGGGHYPAPAAAIDAVRVGLARGIPAGLRREADHVASLVTGDVSRNLVRIFLESRGERGAREEPLSSSRAVSRIGILGAGVMGGTIAAVAASRGVQVRLRDVAREPLERGLAQAHRVLSGRGRRRRPEAWTLARFTKIAPALSLEGFAGADLVIEAVVEDLEVKRRALSEIEALVREDCVLASNTSSLSIDAIAAPLARPGRCVGLHFFNPADRMPLVEVIRGPRSDPDAVSLACAFARGIGKTVVVAADAPGFVVNRLLMPYLAEALRVLAEGAGVEEADRAMVRFGMPMGPFTLLDQIGIDVAAKVARVLASAFGERLPPPDPLEALARSGRLGAKSGSGFYSHAGKRLRSDPGAAALVRSSGGARMDGRSAPQGEALVRRLLYPMINEAARVLSEGVADSPATIDLAMVFGTGFPPFLGGPLRWADREGIASVASTLHDMAGRSGAHLAPSEALLRLASGAGRFHPA